jgi:hypothetical protein
MEFESFHEGTFCISVPEGEAAAVDSLLAISDEGEDISASRRTDIN